MSARRLRRMFFSCHSAQLGGDLVSTTSSAAALPQVVPIREDGSTSKLARPNGNLPKALVKVLEHAVDLCRRSRMVPMRKTAARAGGFFIGTTFAPSY